MLVISPETNAANSYQGYSPQMQYQQNAPQVVGWSIPQDISNGPVMPQSYSNPDIICHVGATPAPIAAKVTAGSNVTVFWSKDWPQSHKGPMLDYLAPCPGNDCSKADKTQLKFFKIDAVGLLDGSKQPSTWGSDQMFANNMSWTLQVPASVMPGQYVLRHETISLHQAQSENGAQNYPFCLNVDIQGSGTAQPEGVLGTQLYTPTDPGVVVNIYTTMSQYQMPGPAVFTG